MAISTGSLGPLLQGVSQQDARVRLEGQVTEQINLLSDVTKGLSSRPATSEIGLLSNANPGLHFMDLTFQNREYIMGYNEGTLKAWLLDGTEVSVLFDAGTATYIGDEMRFHVVDDKIVLVNRSTIVRALPATPRPDRNLGVFFLKGGEFSRQYVIDVVFVGAGADGSNVRITASYETPDGNSEGDGLNSQSIRIAQNLLGQIVESPLLPAGTVTGRYHDSVAIYHPQYRIRLNPGDGTGGETLFAVTDTVRDPAELPRYAPNGMLVEVKTSKATEDNYWLRYNCKTTNLETLLSGFGNEGVWEEWRNPYIQEAFNLATMPHVVIKEGSNLRVKRGDWLSRQVGDEKSAPFASIKDKPIRDIGGFESRLVLMTPTTVVMSRTNHPYDLWRESATVISATDPIDMSSTKKDDLQLDWLIPFDRDMFVVADPGDSQFVIRGGGIDPNNASMVLTTEYEIESAGCPPVSTGRTLLFPYTLGEFSGVNEFYTSGDNSAQAANSLTENVSSYINGKINGMRVSQNFNLAVFTTEWNSNFDNDRTLWVYKYLWDGTELLQSAWSKWVFRNSVLHFFFNSSRLYTIVATGTGVSLEYLDLNRPNGPYGYHISMDSVAYTVTTSSVQGYSLITRPIPELKFIQHTGCSNPGMEVVPESVSNLSNGDWAYRFDTTHVPIGSTVISGVPVHWELEPTEVFARDFQQRIDTSRNLTIQDYTIGIKDSGYIKADFISPYSDTVTYGEEMFPLDGEPDYPNPPFLISEDIVIPWGERSDWSTLRLHGDDYRPVTIIEIQWAGQVLSPRGKRA